MTFFVIFVIGICIGGGIVWLWRVRFDDRRLRDARKEAVLGSRRVMTGQITEQIAPLLPGFGYNYKDCLFMGKGVDYIVFDGISDGKVNEIVLVEVKTGRSILTLREKQIKHAVDAGNVRYEIVRVKL